MTIKPSCFSFLSLLLILASCTSELKTSDIEAPERAKNRSSDLLPYVQILTDAPVLNEPKVGGEMRIFERNQLTHTQLMGIEYRGSTSYRLSDKKSYGVETWDETGNDLSVEVLGMPSEEDWILMGQVFRASTNTLFDTTFLFHRLGYELFRSMGNYAARSRFVELEINDQYLGIYLLMEKLKRDENRINIQSISTADNNGDNITGGYILKIDKTSGSEVGVGQPLSYFDSNWDDDARYTEAVSFRSDFSVFGQELQEAPFGPPYHSSQYLETYFVYEYPDYQLITPEQKNYIQSEIGQFERALLAKDGSYTNFIDLQSFVDYFILNELTMNEDAYRLSTFLYKDRNGPIHLGPVWDLNIGYHRKWNRVPESDWIANFNDYISGDAWMVPFWWDILLEDESFKSLLKSRWQTLRSGPLQISSIENLIDSDVKTLKDSGAIGRNFEKWIGIDVNYDSEISALKDYLNRRINWMDQKIQQM